MKKFGCIYKITNLTNNKVYIGQTIRLPHKRFYQHKYNSTIEKPKSVIAKAIKKYGINSFTFEILEENVPYMDLSSREAYYIDHYNSAVFNHGYNIFSFSKDGSCIVPEITKHKMKVSANSPERLAISINSGSKTRGKKRVSKSKYIMVKKSGKNWSARVYENKKCIYLGSFTTEEEAAKARDIAELRIMGDKAILNFPELKEQYLNNEIIVNKISNKKSQTKIRGVFYCKRNKQWIVKLKGFKTKYFKNQIDAENYAKLPIKL